MPTHGHRQEHCRSLHRMLALFLCFISLHSVTAHTTDIYWFGGTGCAVTTFYACTYHYASDPSNGGEFIFTDTTDGAVTYVTFDSDTGIEFSAVPVSQADDSLSCGYTGTVYSCRQASVSWLVPGRAYTVSTSSTTAVDAPWCTLQNLGSITVSAASGSAVDTDPPTFVSCPTGFSYTLNENNQGIPDYTAVPVVSDCNAVTLVQSPAPGAILPGGLNTVTFTATDEAGNTATCSAPVTAPVLPLRACTETEGMSCHELAYCEVVNNGAPKCVCPTGVIGDGYNCETTGWTARATIVLSSANGELGTKLPFSSVLMHTSTSTAFAVELFGGSSTGCAGFDSSSEQALSFQHSVVAVAGLYYLTVNAVFATEAEADCAATYFNGLRDATRRAGTTVSSAFNGLTIDPTTVPTEARVYTWVQTQGEFRIMPAGLEVDSVYFKTDCENSGCWVIDFTYTTGQDAFNTFYMPRAAVPSNFGFSIDYDYDSDVDDTFDASNFPCSVDTTHEDSTANDWWKTSTCCIPQVVEDYRPTQHFQDWYTFETTISAPLCVGGVPDVVQRPGGLVGDGFGDFGAEAGSGSSPGWDVTFPTNPLMTSGPLADMSHCNIVFKETVDPYILQYKATVYCDEVELRSKAGILKGTVGVEHTVDTFLGIANFKPTSSTNFIIDTFASQTAIHLEKTSFFSVSSHGTNAYTFLQYVNLRLVAVYDQDTDFSGLDEASVRTVRTDSSYAAHYVQVTFTMGPQYGVNDPTGAGLIPLDSVRAGKGDFFDDSFMMHKCLNYANSAGSFGSGNKATFDARFNTNTPDFQDCAPAASMCISPTSVPDQFVSFNIPLGIDWFPDAEQDLSANVFVDLVVNAEDTMTSGAAPNDGGEAEQMKTTLTASIPVVAGGVNIFCDGVTAKTDLKDVADADLIIGSANGLDEMSRLTIFENIASTNLDEATAPEIDTDSIESGLMTLVLKGNSTYFTQSAATSGYSLELEDVITVHIMEDNVCDGSSTYTSASYGCVFDQVKAMAAQPSEENDGDTDGFKLNDAFAFRIDRAANRAHLEPTPALTDLCPFSPQPPSGSVPLETCILRRDVRFRGYPHRSGGYSTAMEILVQDTLDEEAAFMTTVMGASVYAKQLGRDFATAVGDRYAALGHTIDGRYNRAFWINPGYEWTPTQTGGESVFTLSQKIFMFALINLNENYVDPYEISCGGFPGSVEVDGKCFFVPSLTRDWNQAQAECVLRGATLASINSVEENNAIETMLGNTANHWIGMTDAASEGAWVWADGSAVSYTKWHANEPNDSGGQDCALMWTAGAGTWDDQACTTVKAFVCSAAPFAYLKPAVHLPSISRRMLLSTEGSGASVGAASMSYNVSPRSMMAAAFDVPEDRVATFNLEMELTETEACMDLGVLQSELRLSLEGFVAKAASPYETLQVMKLSVDRGDVVCSDGLRRSGRVLLSSTASAQVELLIVFSPGTSESTINLNKLTGQGGIITIDTLVASDKVQVDADPEVTEEEKREEDEKKEAEGDSSSSSSSNMGLIAGICGGVGALVLIAGVGLLYLRSKSNDTAPPEIVSAVSLDQLKTQLGQDV